jgi:MFS family permease
VAGRAKLHHDPRAMKNALRTWFTIFLPFALGYLISYVYRTVNAVVAGDLAQAIGADAAQLGILTSAYFLAFAVFQLPLGILLDRFGPRRVEGVLLMIGAAGALVFSLASDLATLTLGRAVIGLGVSGCLMGAFKQNVLWWPKERLPSVNGMILSFGGIGAFFASTPVEALLRVTDWRGVFRVLAGLTVLAALYMLLAAPEKPRAPGAAMPRLRTQIVGLFQVYRSRLFWRVAPLSMTIQATFMAYVGLWAGVWLREVNGLTRPEVAYHLQWIAFAMIAGYLGTGAMAAQLTRLGVPPLSVAGGLVALFILDLLSLVVPGIDAPLVQWTLFGLLATGSVLPYAILSQSFPPELGGRVNTALNVLTFLCSFTNQAAIGGAIDLFVRGGLSIAASHRAALGILLALVAAAFAWFVVQGRVTEARR